ncbi:MAG: hypothetical protein H0U67_07120 [Gemmatimonadetes bacterium]|nr:hypothetical protein [Gemmatimonadota bacterium]
MHRISKQPSRSALTWVFLVVAAAALGACTSADSAESADSGAAHASSSAAFGPDLAEVRAATSRFRDVNVALAEGYLREPADICHTAEMMGKPAEHGAMGIHFARMDLLGITGPPNPRVNGTGTHTDFRSPAVLLYEPQEDGSLELVAVENLVFIEAWHAAGHTAPPSFEGVPYDRMVDDPNTELDEAHEFEPHYDRHVWLYRDNPRGMFAQFNPNVTCKHHKQPATHEH